jgi:4-amino-4-deoxy-L-arabinose transferase-like glycosyltransferase
MQIIEFIDNKLEKILSKTIFSLLVIVFLGLIIRVYFTPWHLPTDSSDSFIFMIEGLAYSKADFSVFNYRFLWPVFLSVFFGIFRFDDYFGYMTLVRILSITVSLATIPIVYLVSKEFVKEKYALIAAVLFTIESNLVENSIFGQTEPLFILFGLTSFYFILQKNHRYQLLAFVFAGLAFDTRLNGIVLFLLLIFALLLKIKQRENSTKNLILGIILFLLISVPAHIVYPALQGEEIFPFLRAITITILESQTYYSISESSSDISSGEIIFNGIKNEFLHIFRISIPYLIVLFPIGVIISLKNIDFKKKMLFSVTIISLIVAIPQYTISNEFRNLFFLIPFFCIFSAIGIQKLTEKIEIKNLFLILLVAGLILLSANFLRERYDIDEEYFLEKDIFGKYVANNFEGNITGNLRLEIIRNMPDLKITSNHFNDKLAVFHSGVTMDSISQLMKYSKENKIDFLVIEEQKFQKHYPIFNEILIGKNQYAYLEEVFDSNSLDYKKLQVKIFKINWDRYNEL